MHSYSKISPIFKKGDIKYYWRLHCKKMNEKWKSPITYARFWDRLHNWWQLKVAIETPNTRLANKETSIDKNTWREFVMLALCDEDLDEKLIQIDKTLDEIMEMNKIKMPKPKPTLWQRIIRLFKKGA